MNTQPKEKQDLKKDTLDVVKVWKTIQGEGPFAGRPAIFIRLAGCNLQCKLCDTDYTSQRSKMTMEEVYKLVKTVDDKIDLIVITGGEPFRQNICGLLEHFQRKDVHLFARHTFTFQIETNGTLPLCEPDDEPFMHSLCRMGTLHIVCSPKTPTLNPKLEKWITNYKYILDHKHVCPKDGLPTSVLGEAIRPARPQDGFLKHHVYVQPQDDGDTVKNASNLDAALKTCLQFKYTLSLQLHKQLGVE